MSDIVYTIGVVLAIILLLVFLRGVFVRRAQTAHRPQTAFATPLNPRPGQPRVGIVVVGGGWRDGGVGGIGYGRDYQSLPWPPAVAATGRQRSGNLEPEISEQLPQYEASPPQYDTIYKNGPPTAAGHQVVGTAPVEMADLGGSSTAAAAAAPSQHQPESRGGDIGIPQPQPESGPQPHVQPQSQTSAVVQESTQQQPGIAGRVWSRIGGRLNH
ncbi:hypothetical protein K440DRAFT_622064 [Wilcoxina mikolae CBS 423.85]|nr:hypothetical protein K440DRAFT_622064 [Wilcoxina mikolae CBS 423.85]